MKLEEFLLTNKTYHLQAHADTWQDAIKLCVDLLVSSKSVEPAYYDAILKVVEECGPYFVLVKGFAMPHARPENMIVHQTSVSLVTLQQPVYFGNPDTDPVQVLLCIASNNPQEMTKNLITAIMEIIEDEENLNKLQQCLDLNDLKKFFKQFNN